MASPIYLQPLHRNGFEGFRLSPMSHNLFPDQPTRNSSHQNMGGKVSAPPGGKDARPWLLCVKFSTNKIDNALSLANTATEVLSGRRTHDIGSVGFLLANNSAD